MIQERLEEYKRLHTIGKVMGVESHVLSPQESKELYPLMNVDDVYGTLYSPRSAQLKVIRKFFLKHNKSFRWHLGDYEKHDDVRSNHSAYINRLLTGPTTHP